MKIETVVFPAAGIGSRFLPATKAIPKEMLIVIDKPVIQYAVEEARNAGCKRFVFVLSQDKEAIQKHFSPRLDLQQQLRKQGKEDLAQAIANSSLSSDEAIFVYQNEPLGLGHAVMCAQSVVNDAAFAIILPDELLLPGFLPQMIQKYKENTSLVACGKVLDPQNYGILSGEMEKDMIRVTSVVEKPQENPPSDLAILGRYILPQAIFKQLNQQKFGAKGEIQLTDAIANIMNHHQLYAINFLGQRFDCGKKDGWLLANKILSKPSFKFHDSYVKFTDIK